MAQRRETQTSTQQTRRFDHVYDPVYTASGYRDHARTSQRAVRVSVQRVPDQHNMFSQIPSVYRPHHMRLTQKSDLPAHVDTSFRGPTAPSQPTNSRPLQDAVSGSQRHKYFRRPMVPVLNSVPPEILLDRSLDKAAAAEARAAAAAAKQVEPAVASTGPKTMGTQTMYRESEAQTLPYTPDYVIPKGANPEPEILSLAKLRHGKGLPLTLEEVEVIERARFKKKFLASLPPITDEASFALRKRMMEEQELREFRHKEQDIDRVQAEHLRLLKQALDEREAETQFASEQRIENMRQAKLESKDTKLAEIQRKRIKQLRKLAKARAAVNPERPSYELIAEYSNFASKMYAPQLRDGTTKLPQTRQVSSAEKVFLDDYGGMLQLEDDLPMSETEPRKHRPNSRTGRSRDRKQQSIVKHLEWMDQVLRSRKPGASADDAEDRERSSEPSSPAVGEEKDRADEESKTQWRRRAEKISRPPTPRASAPTEADELAAALTVLQQLIRGRAMQTMMYEGKMKRLDLIRELRTEEELIESARRSSISSTEAKSSESKNDEAMAEAAAWSAMQGEVVSSTLDLLSKELVRMQQEREVFRVISDAVEIRHRREMMQGGTRQAEELQRNREDEVYRQLMLVHQGTVDSYFDEALSDCIEIAAADRARKETNTSRPQSATSHAEEDDQSVVQGLVSSFLLPHVERESVRSQIQLEERRFVEAAHKTIYDMMSNLDADESKIGDGSSNE